MKKIHKLDYKPEYDFTLIGISSHENDYKITWDLNTSLKINLTRDDNLVLPNQFSDPDIEFSKYVFHDEESFLTYHLISNRSENGYLAKELKNIDYFLKITGTLHDDTRVKKLIEKIRNAGSIVYVTVIDLNSLKSKNSFLF